MYRPRNPKKLDTLTDYLESEELAQVKSQLRNGQAPVQCQRCVEQETANAHSFRLLHNKFNSSQTREILSDPNYNKPPTSLQVQTSNTCKLLCLPCSAGASYVREVELNKLGFKTIQVPHLKKNPVLDNLHEYDFEEITLLGGEPFGDKVTFECLEKLVAHGKSKNITLDLNTNGTLITREKMNFLSENFKFVYIKASIDGIGAVNDYLRYPSNWQDLEPRVLMAQEYDNVSLLVTTALSNLSLLRYYQVVEWAVKHSIKDLFLTPVHHPAALAFDNLPVNMQQHLLTQYQDLKKKYTGTVSEKIEFVIDTCINSCSTSKEKDFSGTIAWLQRHDQHRGNRMSDVFPELESYAKA